MRMAELSRSTGVPVATIKYYLREGLLPAGERSSPNQADYGQAHVQRLKLIRGLVATGGLSISAVKDILAAVDADEVGQHKVFGVAQATITPRTVDDSDDGRWARDLVAELIARRGWQVPVDSPAASALAGLLVELKHVGGDGLLGALDSHAAIAEEAAGLDIAMVAACADLEEQVRTVVVGTILGDALTSALRRVAQQALSAQQFGT